MSARAVKFAVVFVTLALVSSAAAGSGYHVLKTIPIASGEATWDFGTIDESTRRLFVAHETQVEVLDVDSGKKLGTISDMKGAHGIALAPEFKHGFVTNGDNGTITMFDLNTLARATDITAGNLPDSIVYDPATRRVFAFNTMSRNSTVINASDGKVVGSIDLDGKPEFTVADGSGHVFVDLVDKGSIARIDSQQMTISQRWPVADCDRPTSLAIDKKKIGRAHV